MTPNHPKDCKCRRNPGISAPEERSGGVWQVPASERPSAGKLTRDRVGMVMVSGGCGGGGWALVFTMLLNLMVFAGVCT